MRRVFALVFALVVAAALSACGLFSPAGYRTVFPPADWVDALPVTLIDRTGLATGIAVATSEPGDWDAAVTARADGRQGLRVTWLGGGCDESVTIRLTAAQPGSYLVTIDTDLGFGFLGCPAVGIGRAVTIDLSAPIDPPRVQVSAHRP